MFTTSKRCHYFILWIKQSLCIKTHNVLTDNCKKIRPEYQQLANKCFKDCSYYKNTMLSLKAVLKMITAWPDTSWKTMSPTYSCSNDGVIHLGPFASYAMFEVMKISGACFLRFLSAHCCQPDLNLTNLEATVLAKWSLAFHFPETPW